MAPMVVAEGVHKSFGSTPVLQGIDMVVQPGDTLWAIARNVAPNTDPRITVDRIITLNKLPNAELAAGELLALPS